MQTDEEKEANEKFNVVRESINNFVTNIFRSFLLGSSWKLSPFHDKTSFPFLLEVIISA